jgi:hypothetical protein
MGKSERRRSFGTDVAPIGTLMVTMQIRPKWIEESDFVGELEIDDYVLGFDEHGPLDHLNVYWAAVVHFCKTLDSAQEQAKQAITRALANSSPDDPEGCFMLHSELECVSLADETLTKATIFIVLCSFKEFALKELYYQLKGEKPLPKKRGCYQRIQKAFIRRGLWPTPPELNERFSHDAYSSVRNNFAHGDWTALKKELPNLELHDEFGEVVGFLREIADRMHTKGLSL